MVFAIANTANNGRLLSDIFWIHWAKEMQQEESKIIHSIKTPDSKLGTRVNLFQPSVFMSWMNKPATEDGGSIQYSAMEWSGNFRIDLELERNRVVLQIKQI